MTVQLICGYSKKWWRRKLRNRILETYESVSLFSVFPNPCSGTFCGTHCPDIHGSAPGAGVQAGATLWNAASSRRCFLAILWAPVTLEGTLKSSPRSAASPLRLLSSPCLPPLWHSLPVVEWPVCAAVSQPPKMRASSGQRACLTHGSMCRPGAQSSHSKSVKWEN